MIIRNRSELKEQKQQDINKKKRRHKNAFQELIEEIERRGGYQDRAVIDDPHRARRERRRPHS